MTKVVTVGGESGLTCQSSGPNRLCTNSAGCTGSTVPNPGVPATQWCPSGLVCCEGGENDPTPTVNANAQGQGTTEANEPVVFTANAQDEEGIDWINIFYDTGSGPILLNPQPVSAPPNEQHTCPSSGGACTSTYQNGFSAGTTVTYYAVAAENTVNPQTGQSASKSFTVQGTANTCEAAGGDCVSPAQCSGSGIPGDWSDCSGGEVCCQNPIGGSCTADPGCIAGSDCLAQNGNQTAGDCSGVGQGFVCCDAPAGSSCAHNGMIDGNEVCDPQGPVFSDPNVDCTNIDVQGHFPGKFSGGELGCSQGCLYDTSQCTLSTAGSCSAEDPTCPDGFVCNQADGECIPGGPGSGPGNGGAEPQCRGPEDCPGDEICRFGHCGPPGAFAPIGSTTIEFENPLDADSFTELIDNIIDFIFTLALIIAPILLIIAGIIFMTALGDPGRVATARRMLLWTIIGFGIILISKGITFVLRDLLGV